MAEGILYLGFAWASAFLAGVGIGFLVGSRRG